MSTMFHSRGLTNRTRLLGAVSIVIGLALVATVSVVPVAAAGCISASDCLSKMTLAEKAGQMTQVANTFIKSNSDIATYGLGSVLSGGGGGPNGAGGTATQWKAMVDNFQSYALQSRLGIPLLYGLDAVHGNNNVAGAVIFPHNIGMGASRDAALVQQEEDVTRQEVLGSGIRWSFAPCVCVARDDRWGRTYESYGEDPSVGNPLAAAAVTGFQGTSLSTTSVLSTAKHFVADGGTLYGTGSSGYLIDQGDARITEAQLDAIHLPPFQYDVNAGLILQSRVDDAVTRILNAKFALGLFAQPYTDSTYTSQVGSAAHRAVARQAVRESLVLLKNDGVLPLSKTGAYKIVVGGKSVDNLGYQMGGWSISWQGGSGATTTGGTTFWQALQQATAGTNITLQNVGTRTKGNYSGDIGIWVGGETPYAEGKGDSSTLAFGSDNSTQLSDICQHVKKCIAILYSGRPVIIGDQLPKANAFVAAWLPGTEGEGITDDLFGGGFIGKLPMSWPKAVTDEPINSGDGKTPLFPLGYGLSPY